MGKKQTEVVNSNEEGCGGLGAQEVNWGKVRRKSGDTKEKTQVRASTRKLEQWLYDAQENPGGLPCKNGIIWHYSGVWACPLWRAW